MIFLSILTLWILERNRKLSNINAEDRNHTKYLQWDFEACLFDEQQYATDMLKGDTP